MVLIRDFRESDAAAIRSMMQRLAEQRKESAHHLVLQDQYARFFAGYLQSFLKDPDSVMKVAEEGGKVVGYAIASRGRDAPFFKYSHVAKLSDVFVDEKYRNQGVAHQLLEALEAWARKARLQALEVDVFPEHKQEIGALEGLGFVQYRIKFLRPLEEDAAKAPGGRRSKPA